MSTKATTRIQTKALLIRLPINAAPFAKWLALGSYLIPMSSYPCRDNQPPQTPSTRLRLRWSAHRRLLADGGRPSSVALDIKTAAIAPLIRTPPLSASFRFSQ